MPWLGIACIFLIFIAIAFRSAWQATEDLHWPCDYDLFRDIAFALNILDGRFPGDAYYAGEKNWYNPLVPAIMGGIARLSGLTPAMIYARNGSLIALAVPCAIFVLAVTLFGRWAGLSALFSFLFLGPPELPVWAFPTYSPWLFVNVFSLVLFAVTICVALRAHETARLRTWAVCGILLGLTFLAHTATAVLAGGIACVLAYEHRQPRVTAFRWMLILLPAFVVSTPLLISILWHYGLHIQHSAAQNFLWTENDLNRLPELLKGALNFRNIAALAGFVLLWVHRRKIAARVVTPWVAICLLFLAYGYARQLWTAGKLPGFVPQFHWLFHLRLAGLLLAGYGVYCAAAALVSYAGRWRKIPEAAVLVPVLFVLLFLHYGPFVRRVDFVEARHAASRYTTLPGFSETSRWLRRETGPDAVILAHPLDGVVMIGSAGRRTVVLEWSFSNPYVAYHPRSDAVTSMYKSLAEHNHAAFLELAKKYSVSHVLLSSESRAIADRCLSAPFVTKAFARGEFAVLRVNP